MRGGRRQRGGLIACFRGVCRERSGRSGLRDGDRTGRLGDQRPPRFGARRARLPAPPPSRARSSTPSGPDLPLRSASEALVVLPKRPLHRTRTSAPPTRYRDPKPLL